MEILFKTIILMMQNTAPASNVQTKNKFSCPLVDDQQKAKNYWHLKPFGIKTHWNLYSDWLTP